jgi:hypothetical protein
MKTKLLLMMLIFVFCARAEAVVIEIRDIHPAQIERRDLQLDMDSGVAVEVVVGKVISKDRFTSAAWILKSDSRELVWHCPRHCAGVKSHDREDMTFRETLQLGSGRYEIYYAVNPNPVESIKGLADVVDKLIGGKDYSPKWGVKIDAPHGGEVRAADVSQKALVDLTRIEDDAYVHKTFFVPTATRIRIYAIGEGSEREREMYDYAWIVDEHTRERVWEMNIRNTDHAGGASKNRSADEVIELQPGQFSVYYASDGSHSFEKWNRMPPYDPYHWGISLWAVDTASQQALRIISDDKGNEPEPFIRMNYIRNNSAEYEGFIIREAMNLHVRCLGEYAGSTREFVDFGFIVDARTRETVWKLSYDNTDHGGGGKKNRIFDDYVYLPAGSYLVYYISDDSHAYGDWNVRAPHDPGAWGISLFAPSETRHIEAYHERTDPAIVAQIVGIRDDETLSRQFSLSARSKVRIYAIGEGDSDRMYDYGWLTDDQDHVVWEMRYDETEHAGGAKKNRKFNDVIMLDAGDYTMHYRTDDSHAYKKWNSEPPVDSIHWGVTVIMQD